MHRAAGFFPTLLITYFAVGCFPALAQSLEPGTLPRQWPPSGPECAPAAAEQWQVHAYNKDFYILRESGCSNYEKPFLYLIFGQDRVLLEDTGAGKTDVAKVVSGVINDWAARNKRSVPKLLVVHSHGHGDHIAGDKLFANRDGVELTKPGAPLGDAIDLGGRLIDVLPIPGHDAASTAFYDRRTGLLLTGDTVYPGRLYITDFPAFVASIGKLVDFTATHPIAHILGTHIEQSRTPFVDYPIRTIHQPDEHVLELSRGDLLELHTELLAMKDKPTRQLLRSLTIFPRRVLQ